MLGRDGGAAPLCQWCARERSVVDVAVKAQPSWLRGAGGGSLAAQQGSQQKHSGHCRPGQEPFVEGLLALSHLGSSIVPIEVHKALLWKEEGGEHRAVSGAQREGLAGKRWWGPGR